MTDDDHRAYPHEGGGKGDEEAPLPADLEAASAEAPEADPDEIPDSEEPGP